LGLVSCSLVSLTLLPPLCTRLPRPSSFMTLTESEITCKSAADRSAHPDR
jgi:hypothetical protein